MIEVEVHQQLRAFLRSSGEPSWPHQLTMARLVARALRLGRSALIQTGVFGEYQGRHRLSYLVPVLMWPEAVILVAPSSVQQRLLMVEIPRLQQWIGTPKAIHTGDTWPSADFRGLFIVSPEVWLKERLQEQKRFPANIPTILDGVEDLERWVRHQLTVSLKPGDWNDLMLAHPEAIEVIRDAKVQLTKSIFQHPPNPYECYLLDALEQSVLDNLLRELIHNRSEPSQAAYASLPQAWQQFAKAFAQEEQLAWVEVARRQGQFSLFCAPVELSSVLSSVWSQQPVVLIGGALDLEAQAPIYRATLGLGDLTSVKFSLDRHNELIHLYLPEGLPLPNTPQFQNALLREMHSLLSVSTPTAGLMVLLVDDTPLKAQVGSVLAAEFGSRVQVEKTCLDDNGILVTGWEFWRQHQMVLPSPVLLVVATLPLPSLENPLVAGRVAYYKRKRLDWFRLYLLPTALNELQRAIAPVRDRQGVVAILDSRVLHRSYGQQVLAALSPLARINYLDTQWLNRADYSVLDF